MNPTLFNDRRTTGLLNRVRDDISMLRDDIANLLTHTTRETLPNGAREIADQAKNQFAAGSAYAASRLRSLRGLPHPSSSQSAGLVGGAVVAGLVAYGVYMLCHNHRCAAEANGSDGCEPEDEVVG
jgi:hypothetical protein